jgi:UDP-glucose 4-epimerase
MECNDFRQITMKKKTVLVVGGAGFIGSHVNKRLGQIGYETVVLDNLSRGNRKAVTCGHFIQGDIADSPLLDQIFKNYNIDTVMHFAALIDVGESVKDPASYYLNNVVNTLNLLQAMRRSSINVFIFSSTAAIFGSPLEIPVSEDHPKNPINPYGQSKLTVEQILADYKQAYGLKYTCLRYFNAAGGDPEGEIKNYQSKASNLIPIALQSIQKKGNEITIFGTDYPSFDGTCIRDYIHVFDLANAHISAMERLQNNYPSACYNLGNGEGFSVRQVIQTVEQVTGKTLKVIKGPRRHGDPPILIADSQKAMRELQWKTSFPSLTTMIEHAWMGLQWTK